MTHVLIVLEAILPQHAVVTLHRAVTWRVVIVVVSMTVVVRMVRPLSGEWGWLLVL